MALQNVYRRFLAEEEYVQSFEDRGEVVPPFLVFQPYVIRNGINGYMVPCRPNHPDAEITEVLTTEDRGELE